MYLYFLLQNTGSKILLLAVRTSVMTTSLDVVKAECSKCVKRVKTDNNDGGDKVYS
jgi:hypothetical protein